MGKDVGRSGGLWSGAGPVAPAASGGCAGFTIEDGAVAAGLLGAVERVVGAGASGVRLVLRGGAFDGQRTTD